MKYVFGHKNPDTDSIMSSLVMAEYLRLKGFEAKAFRQGEITKEVKFVLDYLNIDAPDVLPELQPGTGVVLVDHNDPKETVDNLNELVITDVVDHHALKLETSYPLNYRAESVGCTNTVLYNMFKEAGFEISEKLATMMLSAIISDSLLFKSPTFTDIDKDAVKDLISIVNIDVEKYGLELLKAGTDISDLSASDIINADAKTKEYDTVLLTVAQVNTADIEDVLQREDELKEAILKQIDTEKLDLFVLLITDIVNANSMALVLGNRTDIVEKAFNVQVEDNKAFLEGVISRKKQVLPPIEEVL